jgi:NTE family protein
VKLSARQTIAQTGWDPDANSIDLAKSLLSTMQNAHDQMHVDQDSVAARTVFVDTTGYNATDFHLTNQDKMTLYQNGLRAGQNFLTRWSWADWQSGEYTTLR